MSQCFFIGLYDIETGDDLYFIQKKFLIGGNGFQKNQFLQGKMWSKNRHFCQKCPSLRPEKRYFEWPNQNSKNTFIVQTFPKYGLYDFYFVILSLLGAILAMF